MKRKIAWMVVLLLLAVVASVSAEADFAAMTDEELIEQRQAYFDALTQINTEYGARLRREDTAKTQDEPLGKIKDLFPDEAFAMIVRDEASKFSIEQTVTQSDLDQVTRISLDYWASGAAQVQDLTGIGYLRYLDYLYMDKSHIKHLPDEMQNCVNLTEIRIYRSDIQEIPDWIGNLTALKELSISSGSGTRTAEAGELFLKAVPESIGNLVHLERLDLEGNCIAALPESIGNLTTLQVLYLSGNYLTTLPESIGNLANLKSLGITNNNISALPDSIYTLDLEYLEMEGNPIK